MQTSDALTRYGAPANAARPLGRILRWVSELDDALRSIDLELEPVTVAAMRLDIRRYFFMLEGILRLYRERYGEAAVEAHDLVKEAEDSLGRIDYTRTMVETGKTADTKKRVRAYLVEAAEKAEKKVRKYLRANWIVADNGEVPGVRRLLDLVCAWPWDDVEADRRYLCGEIARELRKIDEDELDMEELEDGVHELRRDVRWFPIYLTALDGFARLDDASNPVPAYAPMLQSPAATSPYAKLASHDAEPRPVAVSRALYVANTAYIAELGELKDEGQAIEGLAFAIHESGVKKKKRKALEAAIDALDLEPGHMYFIQERSSVLYDEMKSRRIYAYLAGPFEAAAGNG